MLINLSRACGKRTQGTEEHDRRRNARFIFKVSAPKGFKHTRCYEYKWPPCTACGTRLKGFAESRVACTRKDRFPWACKRWRVSIISLVECCYQFLVALLTSPTPLHQYLHVDFFSRGARESARFLAQEAQGRTLEVVNIPARVCGIFNRHVIRR